LTKLHIDVLVDLALYGPVDRVSPYPWEPVGIPDVLGRPAEQANALGTLLWRTNAEAARYPGDDLDEPEYVFERVGCPITTVEGFKAISCYTYQTADDDEFWRRSKVSTFCLRLSTRLGAGVAGFQEAPWIWDVADVDARADRARIAAVTTEDPGPPPADMVRVLEAFAAYEVELVPYDRVDEIPDWTRGRGFRSGRMNKIGHWSNGLDFNQHAVQARLYGDAAAAHAGYLLWRAIDEHDPYPSVTLRRVARHGRAVVPATTPRG
jgi:hypothetical protein